MVFLNRTPLAAFALLSLTLTACSSGTPVRNSVTFTAGDKASVEQLTYSIVDTQILPRLGDDASPRTPQHRFYLVNFSVSNAGNSDLAIPGMTLVDDSGKAYEELPDGTGVQHWLGVTRRVQSNQTEQGSVIFDAPAGHYKLKLTDDTDANDVFIDIPLSFAHEQMQNDTQSTSEAVTAVSPGGPEPRKKK
jgi:hypothetical protein